MTAASASSCEDRVELFGLWIDNTTLADATADLVACARNRVAVSVAFVNAHCVNVAAKDPEYLASLRSADRLYADGTGMRIAARLAGLHLRDNVNGTDLFPLICRCAAKSGLRLALLGAKPGVADRCAEWMEEQFPGLQIVWRHHGYFRAEEEPALLSSLKDSGADMLFIAMGVPRQDIWLEGQRSRISAPVRLGVGALFDFYSGDVPRAPRWMRRVGLEWLFRLSIEPRRLFRRYILGNPEFLVRALWRRVPGSDHLRQRPLLP